MPEDGGSVLLSERELQPHEPKQVWAIIARTEGESN